MLRIAGSDSMKKICRLLDFTERPGDIDDPWYTDNFDLAYDDIYRGCEALFDYITQELK
jgi:protein-tyrosine phosphatase